MRKLLLSILITLMPMSAFAADRSVGQSYRFGYSITAGAGTFVSGQTPTVKIQKVSNGFFYDFNDSTFKSSGWTSKTHTLTEDSTNGIYYYDFTPPATETAQDQYFFVVDNVNATYGDHQVAVVNYDDIIGTVNRARGR